MAGKILHAGAFVICNHFPGTASPQQTDTRVTVSGQQVATLAFLYTVSNCGRNGTSSPPCTLATWQTGATKFFVGGSPVVISTGTSLCTPSNEPLNPKIFQQRVTAT